jgi:His/Glu/Gln/Arg/opine family amino acid ABC transporter permease subunit
MLEFWAKFWEWLPEVLPVLWAAAGMTVRVTIGALIVALTLGLVVALMRISPLRPLRYIALLYTDVLRGTPALVQLFIIYFGLSDLGLEFDPVTAAIVGLGINGAAYVGEIYRAGIEAIHRGQLEAALSLGMTPMKDALHRAAAGDQDHAAAPLQLRDPPGQGHLDHLDHRRPGDHVRGAAPRAGDVHAQHQRPDLPALRAVLSGADAAAVARRGPPRKSPATLALTGGR